MCYTGVETGDPKKAAALGSQQEYTIKENRRLG
jgi:hypothetical protein